MIRHDLVRYLKNLCFTLFYFCFLRYFDVYSPTIKTLYSQVFWKSLEPVPLPADVVRRFDGKAMAVVGYEVDQVRRTAEGAARC